MLSFSKLTKVQLVELLFVSFDVIMSPITSVHFSVSIRIKTV